MESVTDDKNELTDNYLQYNNLFNYYNPNTKDVLMIGGAAYTYPTYFLNKYKDKNIDVVEIDDKMTKLACKYFNLDKNNSRLGIYHQDGRTYLNKNSKKYDCILIDAFKGTNAPFQLTTYEAVLNAKKMLNNNGVVITNIISAIDGKNSDFIKYEFSTYKKVFETVKVFKVQDGLPDSEKQNLILVGIKGNNDFKYVSNENDYKKMLNSEIKNFKSNKNIVTDDLCPIGV